MEIRQELNIKKNKPPSIPIKDIKVYFNQKLKPDIDKILDDLSLRQNKKDAIISNIKNDLNIIFNKKDSNA